MALLDDIKAKIEQNTRSGRIVQGFSDEELELLLSGVNLVGSFEADEGTLGFAPDSLAASYFTVVTFGIVELFDSADYKDEFDKQIVQQISDSINGGGISIVELRYALKNLQGNEEFFKEVLSSLNNIELSPLYDDKTFEFFDAAVSRLTQKLLNDDNVTSLDNLPIYATFGDIRSGGNFKFQDKTFGDPAGGVIDSNLFSDINSAYKQQYQGLDLTTQNGAIKRNLPNLIQGNLGSIQEKFKYQKIIQSVTSTRFDQIINDFFTDYNTPANLINTNYINFLLQSLKQEVTGVTSLYNSSVEQTAQDLVFYLLYDFEFNRRQNIADSVGELGPDATVEDILNDAEADAINDLASSGLIGEGGFTQPRVAVDPEDAQRFYEQCVLLANMNELKKYFKTVIETENIVGENAGSSAEAQAAAGQLMHNPVPYQERFYMVEAPEGKNQRLLNFLSAPRGQKINDFLSITPDIQAFLTPKLRLFKVFNLEGEDVQQVEFIFKNTTSANTKLRRLFQDDSKFFRGSGYGIKNFSFSFNGTTPATAKNDITAELTLFFQDFSDFVTEFKTTEGTFKFVDLIFYDKKNKNNPTYGYGSTHPDQYSPSYYRIRADVGWNVPEDNPQFDDACRKRGLDPDNVRDVIEDTNRSYYLNMVEHDLNFKKDGTVEIKAQYRGYVESVLKGTDMDALVDSTILADRAERANTMKIAERTCTPGEIAKIKRIYAAQEQRTIEKTRQRFYDRLNELDKIHTYEVIYDGGFRTTGYFEGQPRGEVIGSTEPNADRFNFYFLGDLLYVMLDTMYDDSTISPDLKTKFIIPSIEFEAFFEGSENFTINIAQIPIADRYFEEWWTENVIKEDKRSFPIMFFLRKLLNDLVANALIDVCLNKDYQRSFNFQTTNLNASGDPLTGIANKSEPVIKLSSDVVPFSIPEGTNIRDIMNYVVVYPAYSTTLPIGSGDYTEDLENAVYHFHLGQDRGIINEVKFSKVDMQYIREARYKREGIDGLLQLGAVYTANLQMFGNTLFYPGMQIFINPFGIGGEEFLPNKPNTIANKLGLGGYHLITKVNSSIASGMFKTTVDAQFIYSGDGDVRVIKQGKNEPNEETSMENKSDQDPTCNKIVNAVELDYEQLLREGTAGQRAQEAAIDQIDPSTSQASEPTVEELNAQDAVSEGIGESEQVDVIDDILPPTSENP